MKPNTPIMEVFSHLAYETVGQVNVSVSLSQGSRNKALPFDARHKWQTACKSENESHENLGSNNRPTLHIRVFIIIVCTVHEQCPIKITASTGCSLADEYWKAASVSGGHRPECREVDCLTVEHLSAVSFDLGSSAQGIQC